MSLVLDLSLWNLCTQTCCTCACSKLLNTSAYFLNCTAYFFPSHGVQVMEHYKEFAETHGQGDMAAVAAASEQWAADFDLEAVPDIPQADLPPQPTKVQNCWGT